MKGLLENQPLFLSSAPKLPACPSSGEFRAGFVIEILGIRIQGLLRTFVKPGA